MSYDICRKISNIIDDEIEKRRNDKEIVPKNYTIVSQGGKILSFETNCNFGKSSNYISRRAGTVSKYFTLHSELKALHRLRKLFLKKRKMNTINVINFRITHDLSIKNACCCKACAETLLNLGIQNIIYSQDDGTFIRSKVRDIINTTTYSKGSKKLIREKILI